MEEVNFKNSPPVCENSLATEVVNQISNANFPKSSCRIKNGLVKGVADVKCPSNNNHTKVTLMANEDTIQPDLDISKDKHGQYKIQNCMDNSTVLRKSVETSVNHNSDISSLTNEIGCSYMDPSTSNGKAKRKAKPKVNHDEERLVVAPGTDSSTREALSSERKPSTSLVKCGTDSAKSNKTLVTDMRKLNLEHSVSDKNSDCVGTSNDQEGEVNAFQVRRKLSEATFVQYDSEVQMPLIMKIIQKDLSEPYSIYTYRYFIHNWPKLCFLAMCDNTCVGAIVCKLDYHRKSTKRGYIAMLAVDQHYRNRKIGSTLVRRAIREMVAGNADEVVLETEVTNKSALRLYELLGFVRDKRLFRYYLNGVDALRLKLWLR